MKPLILLHGALGGPDQLQPLAQRLESWRPVHLLAVPGHAGRPSAPNGFHIPAFAEALHQDLIQLGISQADIFGYSMGGYIALQLALTHPQAVSSIFTLGTKWGWNPESAEKEAARLNPEKLEAKVPAFAQALATRHAPLDWKNVLANTANMMRQMGQHPPLTSHHLQGITQRVRIGIGDRDEMVALNEAVEMYKNLPSASLTVLPETSHPIEKVPLDLLEAALKGFWRN